jgi:probable phosphoglycerate mutase
MRIAFLRHGPTEWNVLGRIQGHTDIPLSEEGQRKMRALRPAFEAARIFSSPMLRARQTASALGFADPRLDARLKEQNWGHWEGLTRTQILERDGADAFVRAGLAADFRPPGGESTQELHDRVAGFIADAAKGDGDALAVAHLGVLRAAYTLATGWEMTTPMPKDLDVSKMLVLETDGRTVALAALNVELVTAPSFARK